LCFFQSIPWAELKRGPWLSVIEAFHHTTS
jgi:hypothetical protein